MRPSSRNKSVVTVSLLANVIVSDCVCNREWQNWNDACGRFMYA